MLLDPQVGLRPGSLSGQAALGERGGPGSVGVLDYGPLKTPEDLHQPRGLMGHGLLSTSFTFFTAQGTATLGPAQCRGIAGGCSFGGSVQWP